VLLLGLGEFMRRIALSTIVGTILSGGRLGPTASGTRFCAKEQSQMLGDSLG
jgi:Kef-type K+ transport system membrane component KefB